MNINYYEVIAFIISLYSFLYGIYFLSKKNIYNQLFVYASGCYLLEELWVIVNSLFGYIDGLLTVRLFGIFGTFCFLLTASVKQFENKKDYITDPAIAIKSLFAPFVLLLIFLINLIFFFSSNTIVGFILLLPMIIASYFNLKALLLSRKYKSLDKNKFINIFSLLFYIFNGAYLYPFIISSKLIVGLYDIFVTIIMFILVFLNKRSINDE